MRAKGRRVRFRCPGAEGTRQGILTAREIVEIDEGPASSAAPVRDVAKYLLVVDVITFDGDHPEPWIRAAYYRELKDGRLIWGSQTTSTHACSEWARGLLPALQRQSRPVRIRERR